MAKVINYIGSGKGNRMTFGDLVAFVDDARRSGVENHQFFEVDFTWRQHLTKLSITIDGEPQL